MLSQLYGGPCSPPQEPGPGGGQPEILFLWLNKRGKKGKKEGEWKSVNAEDDVSDGSSGSRMQIQPRLLCLNFAAEMLKKWQANECFRRAHDVAVQVRLCRPAAAAPMRRQHGSLEIMKTTQLRLSRSGNLPLCELHKRVD